MNVRVRFRYSLLALLAAILAVGLPLAWVRHQLDQRAASNKALSDLLGKGIFVTYNADLPAHPWYGFFDQALNPEQAESVSFGGYEVTDDDLRLIDGFVNLCQIHLSDTNLTDEGLIYLARRHENLTLVQIHSCRKITRDGVARFRLERPGVPVDYH